MTLEPIELFRYGPRSFTLGSGYALFTKERGYEREYNFHLPLPKERDVNYLRKRCLLGHPSLAHPKARSADRVLYRDNLERRLREYEKLPHSWDIQSAEVYRALRVTRLAMGNVTARVRRLWRRIPSLVLRFPVAMATFAGELSNDLRRYGITGHYVYRPHLLWDIFRPRSRRAALQGGHLKRCLPAPLRLNQDVLLEKYVESMTRSPTTSGGEDFRQWISEWVSFYRPVVSPTHLDVQITHSACLEVGRGSQGLGGLASLVPRLIKIGEGPGQYTVWRDKMLKGIIDSKYISLTFPDGLQYDHSNTVHLLTGCLRMFSSQVAHRKVCQPGCEMKGVHPRVKAIIIYEKGNKSRIPTMTSVVEQILASIYRSAIQPFLLSDPRIRSSMKGELRLPKPRGEGIWRSQDLTTATDDHDFDSTAHLYLELSKYLSTPGWWGPVVKTITGPHEIIGRSAAKKIRQWHFSNPTSTDWDLNRYSSGNVTKKGQLMGTPTSWPLLPLVTLYSYECSSSAKKKTIRRDVQDVVIKPMAGLVNSSQWLQAVSGKEMPTKTLLREVPSNYRNVDTTGDDMIAFMTPEHSKRHNVYLESVGGRISKNKDFEDASYGVYTEVIIKDGKPIGVSPLGSIIDSHGVRNPEWDSFSRAYRDICTRHGVGKRRMKKLAHLATHYPIMNALKKLGAPIHYPPQMGGFESISVQNKINYFTSYGPSRAAQWSGDDLYRRFGIQPFPDQLLRTPTYTPKATPSVTLVYKIYDRPRQEMESIHQLHVDKNDWDEIDFLNQGNQLYGLVLSNRTLSELWSRTRRWEQVEYEAPESRKFEAPADYLRYMYSHKAKSLVPLEPTYQRVRRKTERYFVVPWSTLTSYTSSRLSIGPYGPSTPSILVHKAGGYVVDITPSFGVKLAEM